MELSPRVFDEMMNASEPIELEPPSTAEQLAILNGIRARHSAERTADKSFTVKLFDSLPYEAPLDHRLTVEPFIEHGTEAASEGGKRVDVEIAKLLCSFTPEDTRGFRTRHIAVRVARRQENHISPIPRFTDPDHAELIFRQLDELAALKQEGILPDLSQDLRTITPGNPTP